jgi:hypothetical protein
VVVGPLKLVRRDITERLEQTPRVVPRDPLQRRELDVVNALPRAAPMNQLRLVEADDGFGERVVVRIAGAADGALDARVGQPLRVANREILRPAVRVVNQPLGVVELTIVEVERVEREIAAQRARHAPADDAAGEDVDHEGPVGETPPGRDVR